MRRNFHDQIASIMNNFDFNRVHEAMAQMHWTWWNEEKTPTIEALKESARYHLVECVQDSVYGSAARGFHARKEDTLEGPRLSLSFEVFEWTANQENVEC